MSALPVHGGNETILVVEDEGSVRNLAKHLLAQQGYKIIVAESGVDALRVWKDRGEEINLVLTDVVMPDGVSGYELGKQLTMLKPGIKMIYTSGYNMNVAAPEFELNEGFNFIQKPYDASKLLGVIRRALDGKELARPVCL